jgi:hypothetical protein
MLELLEIDMLSNFSGGCWSTELRAAAAAMSIRHNLEDGGLAKTPLARDTQ